MQVFISHADAEDVIARRVASEMRKYGFYVRDPESVLPGDNWATAVGTALESSELMVVLNTREARDSANLTHEVQFALTSGNYQGRVVPVLVNFVTIQAGKDVPWVLLRMDPIYFNAPVGLSDSDISQIVSRVSAVAGAGTNASR